jgi:thiol-disulfide isomerase/thioredoxin
MKSLSVLFVVILLVGTAQSAASQSGAVKLVGTIVCCADCWAREDRTKVVYGTRADLEKASECVSNGDPTLLAVMNGTKTTFYQLEEGRLKKPGRNWLEFVGKKVEINGAVKNRKDNHFIKVDDLTVLAEPPAATEQQPNVIGTEVELSMKDPFGTEQKLSSFRGRIVVLNFWATYCIPCRKEMPDLAAIQNEYAALGVQVIGASADAMEDQKKVLDFIKETKINFPVWLGATTQDMAKFGLGPGLPGTVIMGRDGKIVWMSRTVVDRPELKKQIEQLLAQATKEGKDLLASRRSKAKDASSVPS